MKTHLLSLLTIGLLTMLLSCQHEEVVSTTQPVKARGARRLGSPYNITMDISADNLAGYVGNCRNYYATKRDDQAYKALVTVQVSNLDGATKTVAIQGYSSGYDAVSLSGGYTSYRSNGYNWTISGSGSFTLQFYANFGTSSGGSEAIWTVSLLSPSTVPAAGCGDGMGDSINIVKKIN